MTQTSDRQQQQQESSAQSSSRHQRDEARACCLPLKSLSGRSGGGYIAVYIDCRWANSFVLSRGAIELPQYPVIEAGHDIELGQLTLVPGDTAVRLQCGTDTIPITDIENRQVTSYFEGIN
ncbi:conserved hypothetical protein [Culex quinquefasciatus]|uniref:Uncharacterized protein n=1 Tax=Culex quinquefasciatus TaxID=7176 RepID=B0WN76_CULQU|nr:conserved hypothetical protein [Culex quinquefasciatus]|eukprot:XP_001850160.1 conserved hypothetical protein [Culex quinquefasciatus]